MFYVESHTEFMIIKQSGVNELYLLRSEYILYLARFEVLTTVTKPPYDN
jgi:hypothetical protein